MSSGSDGIATAAATRSILAERQWIRPGAAPRSRRRWSVTTVGCVCYAGLVVAWQGLRFTPVGGWGPFELLDIFGLLLFLPLPPLLLLTLLVANRRAGLWLLVPLVLLAWELGPLVLPHRAVAGGQPLRVLTANLLVGNEARSRVGALILVEQPDIVALQELSPLMAEQLARDLRAQYPYQLLEPSTEPSGLGILSRYPFRTEIAGGDLPRPCYCQRVVVDLDGRSLTLVNVHPATPEIPHLHLGRLEIPTGFDSSRTTLALQAALGDVDEHQGPVIVLGDFNTSDRQPMYRTIGRDLQDAYREAGWGLGYTFPSTFRGVRGLSLIRIDYVWHGPSIVARAARTGITPGSDHQHVIADLLLR